MRIVKTGNRISVGVGTVAVFMTMALMLFAYTEMHRIKAAATRITGDTMPSIYLSGQLQSVTLLRYTLLTDYIDPNDNAEKAALDLQIEGSNAQIDDVMSKYESLIDSPTDRQLFQALKSTRVPYDDCYLSVLSLSREGKIVEAQNLIGTQLIPRRNAFLKAAEAEVAWNKAEADDSTYEISKAVNWTSTSILICLVFGVGIACIAVGIRKRLQVEQKLRESNERFRRAFEDAPFGIIIGAPGKNFARVNAAWCKMLGYTKEQLQALSWPDLTLPADLPAFNEGMERLLLNPGEPLDTEKRYLHSNGSTVWGHIRISLVTDDHGAPQQYVVHVEDITARKRAEQAQRESEERFRSMADDIPSMMWVAGAEGELEFINRAYREFSGVACEDLRGGKWLTLAHPDDAPEYVAAFNLAVRDGAPFGAEARFRRADGEWRMVGTHAKPRFAPDGEFLGLIGNCADITERRLLREQLLQAQKLESVGQLAAGIAHEINTPTQYIGDNIRFLKKSFAKLTTVLSIYGRLWKEICSDSLTSTSKEEVATALQKINIEFLIEEIPKSINDGLEGVTRVTSLVSAMKEFSHPGTKEKVALDLNHAIQSTIMVARNEWRYVAEMETDFEPTLPLVSCMPGEFNQVILNLIVNAAHAIGDRSKERNGEKGKITVQTARCSTGVEIRIGDTGGGIPVQARAKIFDPFFTTKEIGKGTGQGLAIARSVIVDRHNGSIDFETVLGEGTTFIIRLPHVAETSKEKLVCP
jgi:two-component system, NtrC family, sensor kinase